MAAPRPREPEHPPPLAAGEVETPLGHRPFVPDAPELAPRPKDDNNIDLPDNPLNPRGKPSLSLPQQATPLTSEQGVLSAEDLTHLDDPQKLGEIMAQDGLAPDHPLNPRGSPDYIIAPRGSAPDGELQSDDAA
jgi:hypothetical protein